MITRAPRRTAVLLSLAFILSCVLLAVFVWAQFAGTIPFAPQGYRLSARFTEVGLLEPGADVRISGVNVGRVEAVKNRGVNSLVTMELSSRYAPVPADTRAILRQKTLLGEAYIELSTGNRAGPALPDGGSLPASQVAPTQQLDQVLEAFGPSAQHDLTSFLSGSASAVAGQESALNDALGNLDPATAGLQEIMATLGRQQGDVQNLIRSSAIVLATLGQRSGALQALIGAGNQVLSATAARNAELTATVNALPPFLIQLRSSLRGLGTTLALAKPSLDALRPTAPLVRPALSELIALTGPATALLHKAPTLIHDAILALPAISNLDNALHPAFHALLPAVLQLTPVISFVGLYHQELTMAMADLAASMEGTAPAETPSGSASYLRSLSIVGDESSFGESVREPSTRSNTYFAPGELENLAQGGLEAATCENTGNPSQSHFGFGNVPCRVQPGFAWGGLTRYFPHVTAAAPPR
ncbi:MAG TPA: MlaD family protein [Solirubrobacteraceae bacterium]|nr:MlaD family protein [Solirubrobacteraceae bacterium]